MKAQRSLPVSSMFFQCDLTLEEEGVHDDNFEIPTVARRAVITCQLVVKCSRLVVASSVLSVWKQLSRTEARYPANMNSGRRCFCLHPVLMMMMGPERCVS